MMRELEIDDVGNPCCLFVFDCMKKQMNEARHQKNASKERVFINNSCGLAHRGRPAYFVLDTGIAPNQ